MTVKRQKMIRGIVLGALALLMQVLQAVPANPRFFEAKQSDGTTAQIRLRGDEFLHWHEDNEGYSVVQDASSRDWYYATLSADGSALVPSSTRVGAVTRAHPSVKHLLPSPAVQNAKAAKAARMLAQTERASSLQTTGTVKQLVILVQFQDLKLTKTKAQFEALFNQIGYTGEGNRGSVRDFYREVSYGKLDVQSVVVGPVTLSHPAAYYGANNLDGDDQNGSELAADALAALVSQTGFSDWAQFDQDGDGWFDELDIIHAGWGEEAGADPSNLWSCRWTWRSPHYFAIYGGLKFGGFHQEPELRGTERSPKLITQVGVICHEFGHSLGLPDLYDTDYSSEGLGDFCLMAGGSWGAISGDDDGTCPVHMSPWCKLQLGWINPTEITAPGVYSLPAVEDGGKVYKLAFNSASGTEFFLLENKTATGFDRGLPGSNKGLLIWHVDNSVSSNTDENHYMVDLEEASGTQHLERRGSGRGNDSDYFRSTTMSSFSATTTPNNKSYARTALGLNISGISAAGQTMTFTVSGNTTISVPNAPILSIGTWGTVRSNTSYIELSWGAATGATSYDVYRATSSTTRPATPIARGVTSPYRDVAATSGLLSGMKYYYWVAAVNAAGTSYSNVDWGNTAIRLELDKSALAFSESGGTAAVTLSTDANWTASKNGSWFSLNTSGNAVQVMASANPDTAVRSGSVVVTAGSGRDYPVSKTVTVTQEPKTSLPEFVIIDHVLVGYNGAGGTVVIPSDVWEIGEGVFSENASVTSVVLPSSVMKIGNMAFYSCTALRSVTFTEGLVEIGDGAFEYSGLLSIALPRSLRTLGKWAFASCWSLCDVNLGTGLQSIQFGAFWGCSGLTILTIPNSVTSLGSGDTFAHCTQLTQVTIGSGVQEIPAMCFSDCSALVAVTVPSTVHGLGFQAFLGCTSLRTVSLAQGVTTLEDDVFNGCTALGTFTVPASVTRIGSWAFQGCSSLTNVIYLGSAPQVQSDIYRATPMTLVSSVPAGSTGWNGIPGSTVLPSVFPADGGVDARAIVRPDVPKKPVATILTRGANANREYIEVTWDAAEGATSYALYRSATGTRPAQPIASAVQSPYRDRASQSNLTPGTRYTYWVEARNVYGSTLSDPVWGEILAINPPSAPVITSATSDARGVTLAWAPAVGAVSYRVLRSRAASQNGDVIVSGLTDCTFVDTTGEPGVDYWYRVTAVNEGGEATSSAETAFRTISLSVDPDQVTLSANGSGKTVSVQTEATWVASASDAWVMLSAQGAELTIAAETNQAYESRNGIITVRAGVGTDHPVSLTIGVAQEAAELPPTQDTGLVSGLTIQRIWPDCSGESLDVSFTLTTGEAETSVPVEIRILDVDYQLDATDDSFIYEVVEDDELYFLSGDELTAGRKRFKVYYYDCLEGSRGFQVAVRAGEDDWVVSNVVRPVWGDVILASGLESFSDGTVSFTTNTTKMAEGWYDFNLKSTQFDEDETIRGVYVCNATNLVIEEGRILTNTVWSADRVHYLRGDVVVPSGVALTIANGTRVRSSYYTSIYVEEGGVLTIQGAEFQRESLDRLSPVARSDYSVSASDVVEFASESDNRIVGTLEGGDSESDFAFVYTYTTGEIVGRLPVPDDTVSGCTFGGWKTLEGEVIREDVVMEENVFESGEVPVYVWARAAWIPARPTNIRIATMGDQISGELVGWRAILSWDAVLSEGVVGYEVAVLPEGVRPQDTDWNETDACDFTLWDIPYDYGISGGEQVCCFVRAITYEESGEAMEFVFTLPQVLELSKLRESVSTYGGSGDVSVSANADWTVTSEAAWLQVAPMGDTGFRFEVSESDTPSVREGLIRVTSGNLTRTFTVVQGGNPECVTKVATPVINPMDGTAFVESSCEVSISCDMSEATLYYTLDGSEPSAQNGTRYVGPFRITATTTIRAIGVMSGLMDSYVAKSTVTKLNAEEEGDQVVVSIGGGKAISIPKSWFDAYPTLRARYANYEAMALAETGKRDAAGNALYVWQDYVTGTDPTDLSSRFKVTAFTVENGRVRVTWSPDLNEQGTQNRRVYRVFGSATLVQPNWTPIETDQPSGEYKFFKVTVDLP